MFFIQYELHLNKLSYKWWFILWNNYLNIFSTALQLGNFIQYDFLMHSINFRYKINRNDKTSCISKQQLNEQDYQLNWQYDYTERDYHIKNDRQSTAIIFTININRSLNKSDDKYDWCGYPHPNTKYITA